MASSESSEGGVMEKTADSSASESAGETQDIQPVFMENKNPTDEEMALKSECLVVTEKQGMESETMPAEEGEQADEQPSPVIIISNTGSEVEASDVGMESDHDMQENDSPLTTTNEASPGTTVVNESNVVDQLQGDQDHVSGSLHRGKVDESESAESTQGKTMDITSTEPLSTAEVTGDEEETVAARQPAQSLYHIKWIQWKGMSTPIITQNENGPCPLLAIINILLLQRRISIPPMQEIISSAQLMEYLGDCILEQAPERLPEGAQLNYEQNMHDAIGIMSKLQTGLDVNVKFTGVAEFEFTPECVVFDLLNVKLLHGWLIDPQNEEAVTAIGSSSYNQLVEKIIASNQDDASSDLVSQGLTAEGFLEQTASQLTYHGLYELNSQMEEEELCVFFRNNHFNTLYKHKKELFLLATDQGYLTEEKVVWETLSNVEGDGCFVDASFRTVSQPQTTPAEVNVTPPLAGTPGISQEDQDYLVALTLQEEQANTEASQREGQTSVPLGPQSSQPQPSTDPPQEGPKMSEQEWSDLRLAMQLQEEERRQQEQEQQQQQQQQQRAQTESPRRRVPQASAPTSDGPPVQPRPQTTQQGSNDKCTIL